VRGDWISSRKNRVILLCAIVVMVALGCLSYSKIAQIHRQTLYDAALVPFQRDLPLGLRRTDVRDYLNSRNVNFRAVGIAGRKSAPYLIEIGEEPGSFVCEPWKVYVAMEFDSDDKLQAIHTTKVGTCL
jgi:hypothetical protein